MNEDRIVYEEDIAARSTAGYIIQHDGKSWKPEDAYWHFQNNGHSRIFPHFIMPANRYSAAKEIADRIDWIFEQKEKNRSRRSGISGRGR